MWDLVDIECKIDWELLWHVEYKQDLTQCNERLLKDINKCVLTISIIVLGLIYLKVIQIGNINIDTIEFQRKKVEK